LRWVLIGLLLLHGLIHLMGFAKAFGYAELPQLTQPISREWGVLWLLAGGLVVATAMMLAALWPSLARDLPKKVVSGGLACFVAAIWIAWKTPILRYYRREEPIPVSAPARVAVG